MKPASAKVKVLVIFPHFNQSDSSHYPYWYTLFDEAAKDLDIAILFESASTNQNKLKANFKFVSQIVVQKQQQKPLNLIERYKLIKHFVNQGQTNIYIHYSYWSVILAWILKKLLSFKSAITHQPSTIRIYYWNCERYDSKPNDPMLNISLKLCDVLVTGHEVIAKAYQKVFSLPNLKTRIVSNWAELTQNSKPKAQNSSKPSTSNSRSINILFVHHLSPRKGSRELPEIINQTLKSLPAAHFHIVGNGPDRKYLESRIMNQGFEKEVTFYGKLPLNQVQGMFQVVDLFIMPSRSEGFPRVILEAMIHKVPFVATDVGCVKDIVAPAQLEYIVPLNEPETFVQQLIELAKSSPTQRKVLVHQNCEKAQDEFSLYKAGQAFINVFQ